MNDLLTLPALACPTVEGESLLPFSESLGYEFAERAFPKLKGPNGCSLSSSESERSSNFNHWTPDLSNLTPQ